MNELGTARPDVSMVLRELKRIVAPLESTIVTEKGTLLPARGGGGWG